MSAFMKTLLNFWFCTAMGVFLVLFFNIEHIHDKLSVQTRNMFLAYMASGFIVPAVIIGIEEEKSRLNKAYFAGYKQGCGDSKKTIDEEIAKYFTK